MIKTNFIMKAIEGNTGLRVSVRVRFLLFYSQLAPLTRDVICFGIYFDEKDIRRQCQMNTLRSQVIINYI